MNGKKGDRENNKGMALLMTILIIVLLSLLILDINDRSILAVTRAKNSVDSLKAYYIMKSGASAAMGFMERDARETAIDTLSEPWAQGVKDLPVGDGTVTVEIVDEASKFNINTLVNAQGVIKDKAVERFGRLLKVLGLEEGLAWRVADWLKRNRESLSYTFMDISELLLVPDLTPEAFSKVERYITVYTDYSKRGELDRNININTVGKEVLASLSPKLNETLVEAVLSYRKEQPFKDGGEIKKVQGIDDAMLFAFSDIIDVKSSAFSVLVKAKVSDTVRKGVAVINRTGSTVKLVAWKEE